MGSLIFGIGIFIGFILGSMVVMFFIGRRIENLIDCLDEHPRKKDDPADWWKKGVDPNDESFD